MTMVESTDSDSNYDSLFYPHATVGMSNPIFLNPSAQDAEHFNVTAMISVSVPDMTYNVFGGTLNPA